MGLCTNSFPPPPSGRVDCTDSFTWKFPFDFEVDYQFQTLNYQIHLTPSAGVIYLKAQQTSRKKYNLKLFSFNNFFSVVNILPVSPIRPNQIRQMNKRRAECKLAVPVWHRTRHRNETKQYYCYEMLFYWSKFNKISAQIQQDFKQFSVSK